MHRGHVLFRCVGGAALAVSIALAPHAAFASSRPDASRLLFLVEYVGSDYSKAVRDGAVLDQMEYGEMLRFSKEAVAEYAKSGQTGDEIATGLAALAASVEKREDSRSIRTSARNLINLFSTRLEGVPSPSAPPDLEAGARVFATECAKCHGERGAGDGPAAAALDPKPAAFQGETIERLTPRHVFNVLKLGVEGTGMVSFEATLSEAQRWDAAFFVMTLREGFAPAAPTVRPSLVLDDLAANTDGDLLALLRKGDPSASQANVDFLRANVAGTPLDSSTPAQSAAVPVGDALATARNLQDAFTAVASRVNPSLVGVTSYTRGNDTGAAARSGWQAAAMAEAPQGMVPLHSGSGFLLGDGGDVATCDHYLRDDNGNVADAVHLQLPDGQELEARVVGMEPALDLAIVRISASEWTKPAAPIRFGDSDDVKTGNWLVALGDPPGARVNFAVGVAAAPSERQCYQEERSATMLQSSLAIAPDAFGGPVADIEGNVVGIAIQLPATQAGPAQPAILPANLLRNLHEALNASGSVESPWLGVSVLELDLLRAQLGDRAGEATLPERGVYIDNIFEPSPATRAGVRRGDFLTSLDGREIDSVSDFQQALYGAGIGNTVELGLQRGTQPLTVQATIEKRPRDAAMR